MVGVFEIEVVERERRDFGKEITLVFITVCLVFLQPVSCRNRVDKLVCALFNTTSEKLNVSNK